MPIELVFVMCHTCHNLLLIVCYNSLTYSGVDHDLAHWQYTQAEHLNRDVSSRNRRSTRHSDCLSIPDTPNTVMAGGVTKTGPSMHTNVNLKILETIAIRRSVDNGDIYKQIRISDLFSRHIKFDISSNCLFLYFELCLARQKFIFKIFAS